MNEKKPTCCRLSKPAIILAFFMVGMAVLAIIFTFAIMWGPTGAKDKLGIEQLKKLTTGLGEEGKETGTAKQGLSEEPEEEPVTVTRGPGGTEIYNIKHECGEPKIACKPGKPYLIAWPVGFHQHEPGQSGVIHQHESGQSGIIGKNEIQLAALNIVNGRIVKKKIRELDLEDGDGLPEVAVIDVERRDADYLLVYTDDKKTRLNKMYIKILMDGQVELIPGEPILYSSDLIFEDEDSENPSIKVFKNLQLSGSLDGLVLKVDVEYMPQQPQRQPQEPDLGQNLATPDAVILARSSVYENDPNYAETKAIDGDPTTDWASWGERERTRTPSLECTFLQPIGADLVKLQDRANETDKILRAELIISYVNGQTETVEIPDGLPNDGAPKDINLPEINERINSIKFQVLDGGNSSNVGLAEFQVFKRRPRVETGPTDIKLKTSTVILFTNESTGELDASVKKILHYSSGSCGKTELFNPKGAPLDNKLFYSKQEDKRIDAFPVIKVDTTTEGTIDESSHNTFFKDRNLIQDYAVCFNKAIPDAHPQFTDFDKSYLLLFLDKISDDLKELHLAVTNDIRGSGTILLDSGRDLYPSLKLLSQLGIRPPDYHRFSAFYKKGKDIFCKQLDRDAARRDPITQQNNYLYRLTGTTNITAVSPNNSNWIDAIDVNKTLYAVWMEDISSPLPLPLRAIHSTTNLAMTGIATSPYGLNPNHAIDNNPDTVCTFNEARNDNFLLIKLGEPKWVNRFVITTGSRTEDNIRTIFAKVKNLREGGRLDHVRIPKDDFPMVADFERIFTDEIRVMIDNSGPVEVVDVEVCFINDSEHKLVMAICDENGRWQQPRENKPPIFGHLPNEIWMDSNQQYATLSVSARDPDGNSPPHITASNLPSNSRLVYSRGWRNWRWALYSLARPDSIPDSVIFTAEDQDGGRTPASVSIKINQPPTIRAEHDGRGYIATGTPAGQEFIFRVLASDPDPGSRVRIEVKKSGRDLPSSVQFYVNQRDNQAVGDLFWTPTDNDTKHHHYFQFRAIDNHGSRSERGVTLHLQVHPSRRAGPPSEPGRVTRAPQGLINIAQNAQASSTDTDRGGPGRPPSDAGYVNDNIIEIEELRAGAYVGSWQGEWVSNSPRGATITLTWPENNFVPRHNNRLVLYSRPNPRAKIIRVEIKITHAVPRRGGRGPSTENLEFKLERELPIGTGFEHEIDVPVVTTGTGGAVGGGISIQRMEIKAAGHPQNTENIGFREIQLFAPDH